MSAILDWFLAFRPVRSSRRFIGLLLCCFVATGAFAQQTGVVQSNTALRAEPSATAKTVGSVNAKSKVEVLDRKAFWLKIKSNQATGWVKMNAVAISGGAVTSSGLAGLSSGRLGSGNIVSASGTRGLSSEELQAAKPNEAAVKEVRRLAVSRDEAVRFAAEGKLKARRMGYARPPRESSSPVEQGGS